METSKQHVVTDIKNIKDSQMEDKQWQSLLQQGNNFFHEQQWSQAEFFYSEAYNLLAVSYSNHLMCTQTLMAWICACHNLSALYETTDHLELSLKFLTVPHEYLLNIANSETAEEDAKVTAFDGLRLTLSPILMFAKKYPICDSCLENFTSLKGLLKQHAPALH
ncbi:hypothetical protein [Colwellia sp. C1TZA3]|uniref:hypothetical protein n=1 Tax=Colwellia sp. C1TZA3 TaxID=2508879 RepID=UPI0011B97A9D|nr:hypothetical protein [Colwellia sp. C1TZA3]TWX72440.1 hypothetical protein ESZ39_08710 [Colwellia sp. C1TZA3]